jgi:transcriptional regulator with PAS, ATPase and Fis domain
MWSPLHRNAGGESSADVMLERVDPLIGSSVAIRIAQEELEYAAKSDAKVLLTGESGVGKEVVARLIHSKSGRKSAPFVTMNCAGVPESLLESELFGHMRGSFTGAFRDRVGLLELANGGTIFMDEVGEMSVRMQALLLRFLEGGEIQRVGAARQGSALDVRVIAATNRNLMERIADGAFREDLYYRLNVIHIPIPPLRDRREDIPLLLRHFLQQYGVRYGVSMPEISTEAMARLVAYSWPGNVRELRNVVERLILRPKPGALIPEDLPVEIRRSPRPPADAGPAGPRDAEVMFDRMVKGGETFWTVVYPPFIARDMTRSDLRHIITRGLEHTRGNYKMLLQFFNMAPADYKRFLNFLRKFECQVPYQKFRGALPPVESTTAEPVE